MVERFFSVKSFSHTSDTLNKKRKKSIPEYPSKSAFMPSNSCNNSNGLQEQNVRLKPYVKPFISTNQYDNKNVLSADVIDTDASSRTFGACLQREDNEFLRSNKPALGDVETQYDYNVSAPYQQKNDQSASRQRLDKHCSSKPVCNERTLYKKEPVFKTDNRGHVDVY